ncbi:hypothetical protein JL720_5216 [Aureococcus anophagefferens]|nr:hypothetical protein JL720_5216 [Aureococcus anophagefferens]
MMASYQDVTLTDAQTHEILCGFSTLLDARCVIVEAALARSKAFHRWRRSAAQPVVTPKGSTPKPTLATVAEAAEDATPRKRRRTPLKERFGLENAGHAADDKAPTPRSRQPVSPVPFDGARRSRQPASPLPVDRAPTPRSRQPASPVPPRSRQPASPVPSSAGRSRAQTQGDHPTCRRRGRRRRAGPAPASAPETPPRAAPRRRWHAGRREPWDRPVRRDPSRSPRGGASPVPSHSPVRCRRRSAAAAAAPAPPLPRADSDAAAPEAPARRLAAPAGEADGAGFSEAFREAAQPRPRHAAAAAAAAGLARRHAAGLRVRRVAPVHARGAHLAVDARGAGRRVHGALATLRRLAGRVTPSISAKLSQWRDAPRRRRPVRRRAAAAGLPRRARDARRAAQAPRRSRPSPAAASGWRCSLCYAQNEPVRSQCALCHQLKIRV